MTVKYINGIGTMVVMVRQNLSLILPYGIQYIIIALRLHTFGQSLLGSISSVALSCTHGK